MSDLTARLSRLPAGERARLLRALRRDDGKTQPDDPEPVAVTAPPDPEPVTAQSDPAEFRRLTQRLPSGPAVAIPAATLDASFAAQVAAEPRAVAVADGTGELDYAGLDYQACQLARALVRRGIGRGDVVPACVPRTAAGIATLLGIIKAGAAYIPVEPALPSLRLAAMLASSRPRVAVAHSALADSLAGSGLDLVIADSAEVRSGSGAALPPIATPDDPAYVLYTSGTSGTPKGVVVSHRAVHHFTTAITLEYEIRASDTLLQLALFSFDVSVFEIFAALLNGARLAVVGDSERYVPGQLTRFMREHHVTVAELPPALMPLLDPGALPDLRLVSVGGEAFPGDLVSSWAGQGRRFFNGYGPTECTVAVTLYECTGQWAQMPPIGRPIANHHAFVLDHALRPVQVGQPGELCIAGPQLALGYLGQPDLTASSFPENPYRTGDQDTRLYRTGDRVRWRPDGNLEYLGRLDRQVKLRGFRIEPPDIEAAMMAYPGVGQAHVEVADLADQGRILVGYLAPGRPGSQPGWADGISAYLSRRLPSYMVPHAFVELAELPLTENGKVDSAALPGPRPAVHAVGAEDRDSLAGRIATEVLAPLLAETNLGINTNFFAVGGDSLQAIKAVAAVASMCGFEVSVVDFLEMPTALRLAELVHEQARVAQDERSSLHQVLDAIAESPAPDGGL